MARGHPDWGVTAPLSTVAGVVDVGELAVRLGSVVSYDRRGNVIWFDDFEGGVARWDVGGGLGFGGGALSGEYVRSGAYSLRLDSSGTPVKTARVYKRLAYGVLSGFGVEASAGFDSALVLLIVSLWIYDGTNAHLFGLRYDFSAEKVQYYSAGGAWVDLQTGLVLAFDRFTFHTFKLVVDGVTLRYERVMCNELSFDVGGIAGYVTPTTAARRLEVELSVSHGAAAGKHVWFDDVILTQNEP